MHYDVLTKHISQAVPELQYIFTFFVSEFLNQARQVFLSGPRSLADFVKNKFNVQLPL